MPESFLEIRPDEVEELGAFVEHLVEEVEQLAETGHLSISLPDLLQLLLSAAEGRASQIHWLLLQQLGLGFLVLLCRAMAWHEASLVLALLTERGTNFRIIQLPAIGIFLDLNQVFYCRLNHLVFTMHC